MDATQRHINVYQAKLAEQAERYDDMVDSMKKVAKFVFFLFTSIEKLIIK